MCAAERRRRTEVLAPFPTTTTIGICPSQGGERLQRTATAADTSSMRGQRPDFVSRALDGDAASWRSIVDAVGPAVLGYARSRGVADPDDVLADVFLGLTKGLRRFEGDIGGIKALAIKIARDRIADRYRRGAGKHETPIADIPDQPGTADPAVPRRRVGIFRRLRRRRRVLRHLRVSHHHDHRSRA